MTRYHFSNLGKFYLNPNIINSDTPNIRDCVYCKKNTNEKERVLMGIPKQNANYYVTCLNCREQIMSKGYVVLEEWTELGQVKRQLEEEREIHADAMRLAGEWHERQKRELLEENKILKQRIKELEQQLIAKVEISPKSGN